MNSTNISREAFTRFYKLYSKQLWFFIFKTCGDESMADDILQDAFYKYLRANPVDLNEHQQKAYLYKTAIRTIIDQKRKIRVAERYEAENVAHENRNSHLLLSMDMDRLFKLLKPTERTLLWLAHVEGYSHREIAAIVDTKEKSVKVQLFRIRKKFAKILKQKGYSGEET